MCSSSRPAYHSGGRTWPRGGGGGSEGAGWCAASSQTSPPALYAPAASTESPVMRLFPPKQYCMNMYVNQKDFFIFLEISPIIFVP